MKYNYFSFQNDFYLQVSGTSMGTICAPNYANLFVGLLEKNFIFNPDKNTHWHKIIKWYRFIDDIFCVFNGNPDELADFVTLLNSFDSNLQFTSNYSDEKVSILDMWVIMNNGSLITTIYRKDIDKNILVLATSCHPTPLKKGLPISQFFHLRRICHSTEDFIEKAVDMKHRFAQRGYPSSWTNHAYELALKATKKKY